MIALVKPEPLDGTDVLWRAYLACDQCGCNHIDYPKAIRSHGGTSSQLRRMEKWAGKHGWFISTAHLCPKCRLAQEAP